MRALLLFVFLMIRRPPRSTLDRSSAASDVYKRQIIYGHALSPKKSLQLQLGSCAFRGRVPVSGDRVFCFHAGDALNKIRDFLYALSTLPNLNI